MRRIMVALSFLVFLSSGAEASIRIDSVSSIARYGHYETGPEGWALTYASSDDTDTQRLFDGVIRRYGFGDAGDTLASYDLRSLQGLTIVSITAVFDIEGAQNGGGQLPYDTLVPVTALWGGTDDPALSFGSYLANAIDLPWIFDAPSNRSDWTKEIDVTAKILPLIAGGMDYGLLQLGTQSSTADGGAEVFLGGMPYLVIETATPAAVLPEPSSITLVGTAIGVLGYFGRRRRVRD